MKQIRTCALALFLLLPNLLVSQTFDHVLGYGFNTLPSGLVTLSNGNWLSVGIGQPFPGAIYDDSIVAIVFNVAGEILLEKRLVLPLSEVYRIMGIVADMDGGFVLSIARNLCDADFNETSILAYSANGTLKWSKHGNNLKRLLKLTSNGQLISYDYFSNTFLAYDVDNGMTLWTVNLDYGSTFPYFYDFVMAPDGNAFTAIGKPSFQRWEKVNANTFIMTKSEDIPMFYGLGSIVPVAGRGYSIGYNKHQLFAFDLDTLGYVQLGNYPFSCISLTATPTNLLALVEDASVSFIVKLDFQGTVTDTVRVIGPRLKAYSIVAQDSIMAILGIHGSGPLLTPPQYLPYNSQQMWLHTDHINAEPTNKTANVSLSQVTQNAILDIDTFTISAGINIYNLSGGQFQIEVKNLGSEPLESVFVNIAFEQVNGFCSRRPAKTKYFSGLHIPPNTSVWLDFGDVAANQQSALPAQLCFWTSAPNHQPDADPSNDISCKSFNSVATNEPGAAGYSIAPNPAYDVIYINFDEIPVNGAWKLYDMRGRQIKSGIIERGASALEINAIDLVSGQYIVVVDGLCLKVVVAH